MNQDRSNNSLMLLAAGLGLGIAAMYFLDPGGGGRRRAMVRDKAARAMSRAPDAAGTTARDLRNRTRGVVAETRSRFRHEDVDDEQLVARVRTALGRATSHPHAITVTADRGTVTLAGPVLARDAGEVLTAVRKVRGVEGVENLLDVHEHAGNVPSLQGGGPRRGSRPELLQTNWAPATRLLAGTAGAALLARAATNLEFRRLIGLGAGRRAVETQKIINVNAPVDDVFEFWTDYQNFPHFMSHVREVRDDGDGMSHWVVDGPAGVPVEWDAEITEYVPNELLAWRSTASSPVDQAGVVRFDSNPDGSTRVDVRLSYNPPAGAVGHGVAVLMGADPKRRLDGDLARVKTMLETGNPAHDAAHPITSRV